MFRALTRSFVTSAANWHKRGRKVSPKEVPLKGTKQFVLRQLSDPYVKLRRVENYRCRSAFKLLEINEKYTILAPGSVVVDLGAAPGSWSQVARAELGDEGTVIAVDLLRFAGIQGVHSLMGDFTDTNVQKNIEEIIKESGKEKVDVVLCDAAPKASGVKAMDHGVIVNLAFSAAKFAIRNLGENGTFLCKLFQGERFMEVKNKMGMYFDTVRLVKPPASRKESFECYILCTGFKYFDKLG